MGGGGGVFEIGNPEGRGGGGSGSFGNPGGRGGGGGARAVWEIRGEGGGVQKCAFQRGGGVDFFGITHSTFFSFTYVTKEMVNSSMCHIG